MKLGKFEILNKIGQGAMGVVYKAHDPFIDRIVALKTITTDLAESPDLLKRFYGEAQSAGRLQHPNIVTIFELGNEGGTPFIAMEFLTGESLDKLIARRPRMPLSQKLGYIVCVCRALEYAHRQNPSVIHRDIKPGNVMVTSDETVKVVDFGIARLGEGSHSRSSGMLMGTLSYMPPDQFRGGIADARSDIWATGIMFYELLCYHRPFDAENPGALMTSIMVDRHRPICEAAPGTPAEIEAIVDRMLCKELDGRYQNMEEVLMELEPVWHQVQQAEVSSLVADGRQLLEAGDLARAEDTVRKALQLDTSNIQAKSLLEKINAELRRSKINDQVKARVEKGRDLLATGQIEEANAEAEAALRLDSTFQPARELLNQVRAAAERARFLATALRASKQRLAEGALTEAELQLDKVLEMDADNAAAQDLLRQIGDEKARRERQARLAETLRRARAFWTNLRYEDCISVLLDAQKEFPGESEIARLLSTARQDHAEHQRQSLLSEARKLLSAQHFEETLRALDRLLEQFPSDRAARNLRTLALQGQEQEKREQRLNENLKNLRAMVEKGKYQEVLESGQKLLLEFPDEFELVELIRFARSEQIQNEQKRRRDEWIKRIQQSVKEERFSVAIQDVQKAQKEFPQDVELLILSERAKQGQGDKERENLLRQRLQEVEARIERRDWTDAIDLARRTLVIVGPHPDLANLLHRAEVEFEQANKKKREQDEALDKARTLLDYGKLVDATLLLENAVATSLFVKSDPRLPPLLSEIEAKKQQGRVEEALKGLRGLLAEGRHGEVIENGKALLQELPHEVELQELVNFAQEEISRERQRQKASKQEIQSLLEAGRFLDAEEAAIRATNAYPGQSGFRRLLEEARSKKREQDERERLRQEIERKTEAQRKEEQERQVGAVQTAIEQGNLAEATQLLNRAIAGKILERSAVLARQLESEIEEKKRKEEQRARELEYERREAREALGRGDFSSALRIAKEGQTRFGSDIELGELARRAEVALEKDQIEKRNRSELLQRVAEYIKSGNISAAGLLLNGSLSNGALQKTDPQVIPLAEQLRKLAEDEKKKRNELQQTKAKLQDAIKKRHFTEAISAGQSFLDSHGFQEDIADLVKQAEVANATEVVSEKRRQAELQTVRGLLLVGNVREAKRVCDDTVRQGILQPQDPDVKGLLKQIEAEFTKQEKERAATKQAAISGMQEVESSRKKIFRVSLAAGVVAVMLSGTYGVYRLMKKSPPPPPPPAEEEAAWLKQAKDSKDASPHQFRKASDLLNQIVNSRTARPELKQEAENILLDVQSRIKREDDLFDKANQALRQRDCKAAIPVFTEVIDINGDHLDEAKQGYANANDPSKCETDPALVVAAYLREADQAFRKTDWRHAINLYEMVLTNSAATPSQRDLATTRKKTAEANLASETKRREDAKNNEEELARRNREEDALWNQANSAEAEAGGDIGKLQRARDLFQQVSAFGLAHKAPADAKIVNLNSQIAAIKSEEAARTGCAQKWLDLSTDFEIGKNNRNSDSLIALKPKLESFARSNCPQAPEAGTMALGIPAVISGWQPPPTQPSQPPSRQPRSNDAWEQDKRAITNLIEVQLSAAYQQRNVRRIQELWPNPYFEKSEQQKWKQVFEATEQFSRICKISNIERRGADEAQVSGNYSGEIVRRDGVHEARNGSFDIRVIRQNGRWIIKNITW